MRNLIYSMGVSLDGFIAGPDGDFAWSAPDEELHRFHNQQTRELGAHLCGRRLYEVMTYWETADQNPSVAEHELEFAHIWQELPKIVFSRTLTQVEGNSRLATGGIAEEVGKLRAQPGKDVGVGAPAWLRPASSLTSSTSIGFSSARWWWAGGRPSFRPWTRRSIWSWSRRKPSALG